MSATPRLLAVASGGGHWIELLRLRPAFAGWDISYVSTFDQHAAIVDGAPYFTVPDATRRNRLRLVGLMFQAVAIVRRVRPRAVISTGSAPGVCFIIAGRLYGASTLWIDSVAQPEGLSMSGRIAKVVAHRVLAQWPEAAERHGVGYLGSVL